jgi:hypothetical protein
MNEYAPFRQTLLGGVGISVGVTVRGDERPDRFDHSERPCARKEAIQTRKHTAAGKSKRKAAVATFHCVHEHHEAEGRYPEEGEQRPSSLPGAS